MPLLQQARVSTRHSTVGSVLDRCKDLVVGSRRRSFNQLIDGCRSTLALRTSFYLKCTGLCTLEHQERETPRTFASSLKSVSFNDCGEEDLKVKDGEMFLVKKSWPKISGKHHAITGWLDVEDS